ncbi:MAG TPA: glycosyltransferase family 39 protein [Gemmatimonadales bacterium]|nr:glycosyltransferase family 39 protein [Gemmatimonadales bacterium]
MSRSLPRPSKRLPTPAPRRAGTGLRTAGGPALVAAIAVAVLVIPAWWRIDPHPFPDAVEYAAAARSLARSGTYAIRLLGHSYPPRYPFGLSALLSPIYLFPGTHLSDGVYGAVAFGVIGTVCVYLLARRMAGLAGGIGAVASLLTVPAYLEWNHEITTETATAAIVSAVALGLFLTRTAERRSRQRWGMFAIGALSGLGMLIRLPSAIVPLAAALALWSDERLRRDAAGWLLLGVGPALATLALGIYDLRTFGAVTATGYRFWVPYWYGRDGMTFSFSYAIHLPGAADLPPATSSNAVFYLWTAPRSAFCLGFLLLTAVGVAIAWRSKDARVRLVCRFGVVLAVLTVGLYLVYYFQSLRFIAPLVPLGALAIGVSAGTGFDAVVSGSRPGERRRVAAGLAIGVVLAASLAVSIGPASKRCFAYRRYLRHDHSLEEYPYISATAGAFRDVAAPGSIIITDALPTLLEDAGVPAGVLVVPFLRKGYWAAPAFRAAGTFLERTDEIRRAVDAGHPAYTDSYSMGKFVQRPDSNADFVRALARFRREPVGRRGPVTIYRLR